MALRFPHLVGFMLCWTHTKGKAVHGVLTENPTGRCTVWCQLVLVSERDARRRKKDTETGRVWCSIMRSTISRRRCNWLPIQLKWCSGYPIENNSPAWMTFLKTMQIFCDPVLIRLWQHDCPQTVGLDETQRNQQERPANCGTKAADVLHKFLPGKL